MIRAVLSLVVFLGAYICQSNCSAEVRDIRSGRVSIKKINSSVGETFSFLIEEAVNEEQPESQDTAGIDALNHSLFDSIEVNRHSVYLTVRF